MHSASSDVFSCTKVHLMQLIVLSCSHCSAFQGTSVSNALQIVVVVSSAMQCSVAQEHNVLKCYNSSMCIAHQCNMIQFIMQHNIHICYNASLHTNATWYSAVQWVQWHFCCHMSLVCRLNRHLILQILQIIVIRNLQTNLHWSICNKLCCFICLLPSTDNYCKQTMMKSTN